MAAWQAPGPRVTIAHRIQPVEQVEVGFARHAEGVGHALRHQRIGQQLPARAPLRGAASFSHPAILPEAVSASPGS
jgi:hypothetical protein